MQLNSELLNRVQYLVGSSEAVELLPEVPAKKPFDESVINMLNDVSREIMKDPRSRAFSDVITFGFWVRKGSVMKLKERFDGDSESTILGKGVAFHVAPSNVPVNFAYTLVAGLLCGNANVVRVPSKDFPQVQIITDAFNKVLDIYEEMKPYVICIRYERDKDINDLFSSIADIRVIWGGDQTIADLRRSPLPARAGEITFADRYSLAVIDSDTYLSIDDKVRVAEDFYNDTFFSDQNACTSPRIVIWTGKQVDKAKSVFWTYEHELVKKKYTYQSIQGVNKLAKAYIYSSTHDAKIEREEDNLIVRISIPELNSDLMDYRDNSGFFYEYDCKCIFDLLKICNDKRCQTIGYIGDKSMFIPLISTGVKGIDRIVPIGKTMDFDLIWDGYSLSALMTRTVVIK